MMTAEAVRPPTFTHAIRMATLHMAIDFVVLAWLFLRGLRLVLLLLEMRREEKQAARLDADPKVTPLHAGVRVVGSRVSVGRSA